MINNNNNNNKPLDLSVLLYSFPWMLDVKENVSLNISCYNTSTAIVINNYLNFNCQGN